MKTIKSQIPRFQDLLSILDDIFKIKKIANDSDFFIFVFLFFNLELFILKQYEEELDYKLLEPSDRRQGKYYKFNENVILRTDAKSQATILTGYVQNGIYTPNEARSYINKPRKEGGDELICNGNYIKVAQIGIEEKKEGGGDNG